MDKRGAKIEALRRYVALLRQEETRLQGASRSRKASTERADAEDRWRMTVDKLDHADKELRDLEGGRKGGCGL